MSDETEAPTPREALAWLIRAASGGLMSKHSSLQVAEAFITHYRFVLLAPGQTVVGPEPDGMLVEWFPGVYDYFSGYTEEGLREAMPGDYSCRPIHLAPVQETDHD